LSTTTTFVSKRGAVAVSSEVSCAVMLEVFVVAPAGVLYVSCMVDHVRAWHPEVPSLREVYHARFDHSYPMHTHDDWAVMLVDDGAVAYGLDRADHHAVPGALTLLPPGVPHDGHSAIEGKGYRKRVLYLEPDWLPPGAQGLAVRRPTLAAPGPIVAARRVHAALRARVT
jgi:hypothetical protein